MTASVWILAYLGHVPGKVPNQVAGKVPGVHHFASTIPVFASTIPAFAPERYSPGG